MSIEYSSEQLHLVTTFVRRKSHVLAILARCILETRLEMGKEGPLAGMDFGVPIPSRPAVFFQLASAYQSAARWRAV
jgi:hypothetical protein